MRTTLNIDSRLLAEAAKITREKGASNTVNAALRELVRSRKLRELREILGTLDWEENWRDLEELELAEMRRLEQ
jgi:Arc/MetJ family transcription regulator